MVREIEKEIFEEEFLELDKRDGFIPMTYDKVFKAIFKEEMDILKIFVIDILEMDRNITSDYDIVLLDTEIPVKNKREYRKTIDIYIRLDSYYVDIEINRSSFNKVSTRNIMYADRLYSTLIEEGTNIKDFKKYFFYQININMTGGKRIANGYEKIVTYDVVNNKVYNENKAILAYYVEYYRDLYYNKNVNLNVKELWFILFSSLNYREMYNVILKLDLPFNLGNRLMRKVINVMSDNKYFEAWEIEKLNELADYEELEEARNEGIESAKNEIALSLLKANIDIDVISNTTGLSLSDLLLLKNEIE